MVGSKFILFQSVVVHWKFFFLFRGRSFFSCSGVKQLEQFLNNLETCPGLLITNKISLTVLLSFDSGLCITLDILKFTSFYWSLILSFPPSTSMITLAVFMNSHPRMKGTSISSSISSITKSTGKVILSTYTSTFSTTPYGHLINRSTSCKVILVRLTLMPLILFSIDKGIKLMLSPKSINAFPIPILQGIVKPLGYLNFGGSIFWMIALQFS